jgi:endonuclease YncB( thermonuclease family)
MMWIRVLIVICLFFAYTTSEAGSRSVAWKTYLHCTLVRNASNDGDSFHVMCDGKERIFRLHFVDCPETSNFVPKRLSEQAAYWNTSEKNVVEAGRAARRYALQKLKQPFIVYTAWEDAKGRSRIPRHFAMIRAGDKFLSEWLVRNGHARVYGYPKDLPDGTSKWTHREKLQKLEKSAKHSGKGAWRYQAVSGDG